MLRGWLQPSIAGAVGLVALLAGMSPPGSTDETAEPAPAGRMTPARLRGVLEAAGLAVDGDWPQVAFYVHSSRIYGLADEAADRVRFMVPVGRADELEPDQLRNLLKANYVATGDLRFAINRDVVWLVYAHPLSSVTPGEVTGAINQLARHAERVLVRRSD